jgi:AbrB family looped-hinge helix DNA binding protein
VIIRRLSTNGQIRIPKAIREAHGWDAGMDLEVEDRGDSIVIRPALGVPRTSLREVVGCLRSAGSAKTLEAMDRAIAKRELRRR